MNTTSEVETSSSCCKQARQDPWRKLFAPICCCLVLAAVVAGVLAAVLNKKSPAPPPIFQGPLRAVAYAALPLAETSKVLPNSDLAQLGYAKQWGKEGRNDLKIIKNLGANAVRLYDTFGYGPKTDHGKFLDAAREEGLQVLPGVDSKLALQNCTNFDCYEQVKEVVKAGFANGFAQKGHWHPAVHTVILFNEPDFFGKDPKCPQGAAWCRVKATLSALDGLLAAEREAKVSGSVKLTTTWSFTALDSIDGSCKKCPGYFGFHDMLAATKNASLANYSLRTDAKTLLEAYEQRWVNALNVQDPWSFVQETITKNYGPFGDRPWFIGEFGDLNQPHEILKKDVQAMHHYSKSGAQFLGGTVFQFQAAYWEGAAGMKFGLFGLGKEKVAETDEVCDHAGHCAKWTVNCLTTDLTWLPADQSQRAQAVADAWNGTVTGLCSNATLLVV